MAGESVATGALIRMPSSGWGGGIPPFYAPSPPPVHMIPHAERPAQAAGRRLRTASIPASIAAAPAPRKPGSGTAATLPTLGAAGK